MPQLHWLTTAAARSELAQRVCSRVTVIAHYSRAILPACDRLGQRQQLALISCTRLPGTSRRMRLGSQRAQAPPPSGVGPQACHADAESSAAGVGLSLRMVSQTRYLQQSWRGRAACCRHGLPHYHRRCSPWGRCRWVSQLGDHSLLAVELLTVVSISTQGIQQRGDALPMSQPRLHLWDAPAAVLRDDPSPSPRRRGVAARNNEPGLDTPRANHGCIGKPVFNSDHSQSATQSAQGGD